MNSVVIGAIADNCNPNTNTLVAPSEEFPAIYSCTGHINFEGITSNNHLRTPDLVLPGGDYENNKLCGEQSLNVAIDNEKYSAEPGVGTSYSTPIAANMAAKLIKKYPSLRMQSIKALMINHAIIPNYGKLMDGLLEFDIRQIVGYGIPNEKRMLSSSRDDITFILEESIKVGTLRTFNLSIPEYLNSSLRQNQLLNVSATLCFKFKPMPHNQLAYCPFHLSFALGKNLPIEDSELNPEFDENGDQKVDAKGNLKFRKEQTGYNGNSSKNIQLSSKGWADDYHYRNKMSSNVQKINFNISKGETIEANQNTFKIAVFAAFQKLLSKSDLALLGDVHVDFSLVVSIKQNAHRTETLNSLYDEIALKNEMVALGDIVLEGDLQ